MPFDVRRAAWPQKRPVLVGGRSKPWSRLAKRWFANATISRPHPQFIRMPYVTAKRIEQIMAGSQNNPQQANLELNRLYEQRIQETVGLIRKTFSEPKASVIFEENGTSALALLRHLLASESDEILTTSDEGRLVVDALKGEDFITRKENFRNPLGFFKPPEKLQPIAGNVTQVQLFRGQKPKTNDEILEEIIRAVKERQPPVVIVPHVSRTGRILPVEEIGRAISEHNRHAERETHFIVDGIQAVGRLPHSEIVRPLSYADAYVFTSAKALGASMQGAIVTRKNIIERNTGRLLSSNYAPRLCFDQFHDEPETIRTFLESRDRHFRVSLPEIHAMSEALQHYLKRREYEETVLNQIEKERSHLLRAFRGNKYIQVLKPRPGTPLTPSIVAFELKHPQITTDDLKRALQSREEPITLPALISETNFLRIGLSEITPRTPKEIKQVANEINRLVSDSRPIVLMPGSFDPFTLGHKENLQELVSNPRYRKVLLLPTQHYRSGTKKMVADKRHRRKMAELLVTAMNHPRLQLDPSDLDYPQRKRVTWHLERLARLHPGSEIVLAVGSNAFSNFVKELKDHRSWLRLPIKLGFHVFFRKNGNGAGSVQNSRKKVKAEFRDFRDWLETKKQGIPGGVNKAQTGLLTLSKSRLRLSAGISSTQVRTAISKGEPFEHLVPPEIVAFLTQQRVYPRKPLSV